MQAPEMDSDQNLIDSLLKLDVSNGGSLGSDGSLCDDTRSATAETDEKDSQLFTRSSEPKSPSSNGDIKFNIIAPKSSSILDPQMDSNSEFVRSPPRYNGASEGADDFGTETFALGALARFHDGEDNNATSLFSSGLSSDNLHDDRNRNRAQSRETGGEASPFSRDYTGYDSRSRSGSNPVSRDIYTKTPDIYSKPSDSSLVSAAGPSPRETPYLSQHGFAGGGAIQQPEVAYRGADYSSPRTGAGPPVRSAVGGGGGYQTYSPQPAAGILPYGRGPPAGDPYYGAPPVDPYGGGFRGPYGKAYPAPYRPAPAPYAPAPHDPYGYGPPPAAAPGYGPRYGKSGPMGYRSGAAGGNYGREDPYYGAGAGYGAPPAYGYAHNPYGTPAPPPQEEMYYGAAAVNRVLGRPTGHDGFRGGRDSGYNPVNTRLRDRALATAEPVNLDNIDPNTIVYQVQFKKTIRNFTLRPGDMTAVQAGDFVVVQADRGEDLGVVGESFELQAFLDRRFAMRAYMDEEDQNVGYIIRVATPTETKLLPEKFQDEEMIFKTCENLAVHTYRLPMTVVDVEYQFDRHKITIFYDSPVRIDFRELVRDLFSSFKARIWMKKVNQFQQPDIKHYAAMALATGVQFTPNSD